MNDNTNERWNKETNNEFNEKVYLKQSGQDG